MNHCVKYEVFQSFQQKSLLVHSNQHLIVYYEFLQSLVRLCNRLIIIMVECYMPFDVIMRLRQM